MQYKVGRGLHMNEDDNRLEYRCGGFNLASLWLAGRVKRKVKNLILYS